jgi:hypothetical protein
MCPTAQSCKSTIGGKWTWVTVSATRPASRLDPDAVERSPFVSLPPVPCSAPPEAMAVPRPGQAPTEPRGRSVRHPAGAEAKRRTGAAGCRSEQRGMLEGKWGTVCPGMSNHRPLMGDRRKSEVWGGFSPVGSSWMGAARRRGPLGTRVLRQGPGLTKWAVAAFPAGSCRKVGPRLSTREIPHAKQMRS